MTRAFDDEDARSRKALALVSELEWFDRLVQEYAEDGVTIRGFSVRLPEYEGDEYFLVVRALDDGEKVVAFRDGDDLVALLRGLVRAIKARKLRFKVDKYE